MSIHGRQNDGVWDPIPGNYGYVTFYDKGGLS